LRELVISPAVLEPLILQLACIGVAFLSAWVIRAATRAWSDRLVEFFAARYRGFRIPAGLRGLVVFCYAWIILAVVEQAIAELGGEYRLIGIAASLTGLSSSGRRRCCCAIRRLHGRSRRSPGCC
jgi:hypothetical protein